jgi:hypothetical protein
MKRKKRRAPGVGGDRSSGRTDATAEVQRAAGPSELRNWLLMAEAAETAETALDVVTAAKTAAAQPSIASFSPAAEPVPVYRPRLEQNPFAAVANRRPR